MNQPDQGGQMPSSPPPSGGMPSWTNNITARGTKAGPAGVALADLPDRLIAWVIDAIILGIVAYIVNAITVSVLGDNSVSVLGVIVPTAAKYPSLLSSIATVVLMLAVSGAYFIYMWSRMNGATVGQRVMKISVRDATSGQPIGQQQAITRWMYVGAPFAVYFLYFWGGIGLLVSLLALAYELYLIYTTANSATRQGFHDVQAKTVVAKG